jgi:hypothetical protein
VTLVAPLPDAVDPGIMARQHLGLAPAGGGTALVLTWRLDLPGADGDAPPAASSLLLGGVRSFRLRYWGAPGRDAEPAWLDAWQGQPRLPGLVSVEIQRSDNSLVVFTVLLRVSNSPACRYYPIGPLCRRPS